jgi:hypothetical protein
VQLGYSSQTAHDTRPMSPLANLTSGITIPHFAEIRSISMFAIALHVCNRTVVIGAGPHATTSPRDPSPKCVAVAK